MDVWPDIVNGALEFCGGLAIFLSIFKLRIEKIVRGVSWAHVAFFAAWGGWNMFYYPQLGQWWSFWGGVIVFTANIIWVSQLIYWTLKEKQA